MLILRTNLKYYKFKNPVSSKSVCFNQFNTSQAFLCRIDHCTQCSTFSRGSGPKSVRPSRGSSLADTKTKAYLNLCVSTYLIRVCRPRGRCGSSRPCTRGRPWGARAWWRHPWGSSSPCHGAAGSSCGEGSPGIRGGEPKTCGETENEKAV